MRAKMTASAYHLEAIHRWEWVTSEIERHAMVDLVRPSAALFATIIHRLKFCNT